MKISNLDIPPLLKRFGITPKKTLGQNFLQSSTALKEIIRAADLSAADTVLEVGAGIGNLTRYLAASARRVVAVELDDRLLPVLREVLADDPNVEIIHGDILRLQPGDVKLPAGYKVVANIPYYITSALIRHLLEADVKPGLLVLTLQSEVAQRMCAVPNDMNLLALSVQVYGSPKVIGRISAASFFPSPEVDSSIVRISLFDQPVIPVDRLELFFRLAKAGFSQKRKTLRNSLSGGMRLSTQAASDLLSKSGIDPMRRAETLTLAEWNSLTTQALALPQE